MDQQNEKYEDKSDVIDNEIRKRYYKWHLHAIAWFDFDDVAQIIRAHIFKKWDQWDQVRPLEPWVNKIISNQLKNILRNNYSNFARPCLNCEHNQSKEQADSQVSALCALTPSGLQCNECDLFAKWEKTKKNAYDIKMPLSLEFHAYTQNTDPSDHFDISRATSTLHNKMFRSLTPKHFFVYKMLFIDGISEDEVARILGYKSNEKGRKAGYKQIKNLKNQYKNMAKKIIDKEDIFYE
jgi:DNA-directed RNA polymerase specialized sigma24 family protein